MMRCIARCRRPLHALFALWFAIVLGDPGVLHACPMHGAQHGAQHGAKAQHDAGHSASAEAADAMPSHSAHDSAPAAAHEHSAQHSAHDAVAGEHAASETAQHGDTPAPCTCVGHCSAASAAAPVPIVATMHVPEAVAEVRHPLAAPSGDVPSSPALRLPFANGPPTA